MIKFKLGYNFDGGLLRVIDELNMKFVGKAKVDEVYGSIRQHAWLAARPDFRLPDITMMQLREHVEACTRLGIVFNYTLNTINPGTREELLMRGLEIKQMLVQFKEMGIIRLTIANPLLIELVRDLTGDYFEIEVSTVAHVDAVTQIQYLHEKYSLKKVCVGIHKNRSFHWLKNANDYCSQHGIELEILANEFCANGGANASGGYTTHCAYRDSCYQLHASDKTAADTRLFDGYPMHHCMASRDTHPANWLRTRFVRPQDLALYQEKTGISKFKISGRTGSLEYLEMVIEAYMNGEFKGNLLALWKPLETITNGQSELDHEHGTEIPCDKLDGFLDKWVKSKRFDCADELCGTTCVYCEDWYNKHLKQPVGDIL